MPASQASIGYGSLLQVQDAALAYQTLAEVYNVTPPSSTVDQVDVTHMQSPNRYREFVDGLIDPGECSFEMNYVPGSPSDILLLAILATPVGQSRTRGIKITYPNGKIDTFSGNLATYEPTLPTDDKMTATVTFRVTGPVTRT
jgi:hypothetical protein